MTTDKKPDADETKKPDEKPAAKKVCFVCKAESPAPQWLSVQHAGKPALVCGLGCAGKVK